MSEIIKKNGDEKSLLDIDDMKANVFNFVIIRNMIILEKKSFDGKYIIFSTY